MYPVRLIFPCPGIKTWHIPWLFCSLLDNRQFSVISYQHNLSLQSRMVSSCWWAKPWPDWRSNLTLSPTRLVQWQLAGLYPYSLSFPSLGQSRGRGREERKHRGWRILPACFASLAWIISDTCSPLVSLEHPTSHSPRDLTPEAKALLPFQLQTASPQPTVLLCPTSHSLNVGVPLPTADCFPSAHSSPMAHTLQPQCWGSWPSGQSAWAGLQTSDGSRPASSTPRRLPLPQGTALSSFATWEELNLFFQL